MKIVSKRHREFKAKPFKFDKIIMPTIRKIVPSMIAADLVKVQPMSTDFTPLQAIRFSDLEAGSFHCPYIPTKLPKPRVKIKSNRHPDTIAKQERVIHQSAKDEDWVKEDDGQWHHVAVTRENGELSTYVDGVKAHLEELKTKTHFLSKKALFEMSGFSKENVDRFETEMLHELHPNGLKGDRGDPGMTHAQEISMSVLKDAKLPADEAKRLLATVPDDEVITSIDLRVDPAWACTSVQYQVASTKPYSHF